MKPSSAAPATIPWSPLLFLAAIAIAIVLEVVYPLPWIGPPLSDMLAAVGGLLVAAAVAVGLLAVRALMKADTTVMPHRVSNHLVTSGPFALSRNPIYLAYAALTLGVGLIAGSLWFLACGIVAALLTRGLAIAPEERHLEARFGKRYRDYAAKVRRWI